MLYNPMWDWLIKDEKLPHSAQLKALTRWKEKLPLQDQAAWLEVEFGRSGHTLMRFRSGRCWPNSRLHSAWPDVVHDREVAYGWTAERPKSSLPSAAEISHMDEALLIISAIPNATDRKLIQLRSERYELEPDRHRNSWGKIGQTLGVSGITANRWFDKAILKTIRLIKS